LRGFYRPEIAQMARVGEDDTDFSILRTKPVREKMLRGRFAIEGDVACVVAVGEVQRAPRIRNTPSIALHEWRAAEIKLVTKGN
jgi:hypothetical protein